MKYIAGICLAYAAGIWIMESSSTYGVLYLVAVVGIACLLKFAVSTDKRSLFGLFLAAVFVIGGLWVHIAGDPSVRAGHGYVGSYVTLTGRVCEEPDVSGGADRYVLQAESVTYAGGTQPLGERVALTCFRAGGEPYQYGDVVRVRGFFQLPSEPLNEGEMDYPTFLKTKNIYFEMAGSYADTELVEHRTHWYNPFDAAYAVRAYAKSAVSRYLTGDAAALTKGILLSDKSGLSAGLEGALQAAGLTHIVVASGLHVSCLLLLVTWLLGLVRVRKRILYPAAMAVLVLFALVQGCSASILRAVIMAGVYLLASALGRQEDRLGAISIAALALLLINPYSLFDVSFQMSFGSVLGILLFTGPIEYWLAKRIKWRWLSGGIAVTAGVQIFILPITAYYFGSISIYSVLANLAAVPAVELVLAGGMLLVACAEFLGFAAQLAAGFLYLVTGYIGWCATLISSLPYASIAVARPSLNFMLAYLCLAYVLYVLLRRRPRVRAVMALSACVGIAAGAALLAWSASGAVSVTFINVGQGDAALLRMPAGQTMLIDGGGSAPWSESDVGESILCPYLMRRGVFGVDVALVSHYDKDHAQGIAAVLRNFSVGRLLLPYRGSGGAELEYRSLLEGLAAQHGVPITYYVEGAGLDFGGGLTATALAPSGRTASDPTRSENDKSIVLKLSYGEMDVLFTGDIEAETERELMERGADLEAEVLKVAHHGSQTSSTPEFISAVSPRYAVISVGERNSYGHPAVQTLNTLALAGAEVYRTDEDGDITVRLRQDNIAQIHAFKRVERLGEFW